MLTVEWIVRRKFFWIVSVYALSMEETGGLRNWEL